MTETIQIGDTFAAPDRIGRTLRRYWRLTAVTKTDAGTIYEFDVIDSRTGTRGGAASRWRIDDLKPIQVYK